MPRGARYPLRRWLWRAFVQCALIPLVLVESVLVGAYWLSNAATRDAQLDRLEERARQRLAGAAQREARVTGWRLQAVEQQVRIFREAADPLIGDGEVGEDGLSRLDPLMRAIRESMPLVVSVYVRGRGKAGRRHPSASPGGTGGMSLLHFREGERLPGVAEPQWTAPYLDSAGLWRMSVIAPIYRAELLVGEVGLEIDLGQLLGEARAIDLPLQGYALLIDRDGQVMGLPAADAVPAVLPVNAPQGRREVVQLGRASGSEGEVRVEMFDGHEHLLVWREIPLTGWRLLLVVDKERILQPTRTLAAHYQHLGYVLIAGLLVFHLVFLALWWRRSRVLSRELERPIRRIVRMLRHLGKGEDGRDGALPAPRPCRIDELNAMVDAVRSSDQQLKASEAERVMAQQLLEAVMENTTESLWEIMAETGLIRVSTRFARRFALDAECVPLETFNQLVHPDDLDRLLRRRESFFAGDGGGVYEVEFRCLDRSGQYVWLLSRGQALERDPYGRVLRSAGTHVDISRLKAVQEDLHRATLEAQDANQAKSRFLSSMSHELRTPLNAVQGFAQLIELEVEDRPEALLIAEYAREIVKASRHLTALVDDILDLSTLEGRRQQLHIRPVEVGAMLAGCAELVLPQIRENQLQLQQCLVPAPLYVQADARRLRQILLNLLSNAIKYNRPQGRVMLGHEVRSDCVRLWVKDTGPGLDAAQQSQLFQPFQRLGRESSNIPGSGIGLVLCHELAGLMNGRMGFYSEPGHGSRFWVDLPGAAAPVTGEMLSGDTPQRVGGDS